MKTKLHSLITGLLMAVCITSFGQETVSEFSLRNGKLFSNTDIIECSDGTLMTGIAYYSSDYNENGLLVCKTSPEGQLIDSMAFDYGTLFGIKGATDQLSISFNGDIEPSSVEVYDLSGRLISTKPSHLDCLDMSAFPAGVYTLRITMKGGRSHHEKIVKQ